MADMVKNKIESKDEMCLQWGNKKALCRSKAPLWVKVDDYKKKSSPKILRYKLGKRLRNMSIPQMNMAPKKEP